jgi:hypothetical protein
MASLDELLAEPEPQRKSSLDDLLAEPAQSARAEKAPPKEDTGWWKRAASMGLKDTFTGPGQAMQNLSPDAAMNVARKSAASIVGAIPGMSDRVVEDVAQPRSTDEFNQMVRGEESAYQAERKQAGREGFDWTRTAGALANPIGWLTPASTATKLVSAIKAGAQSGAFQALLQPVATEGNFLWDKGTQAALGAATGGTLSGAVKLLEPAMQFATGTMRRAMGPSATDKGINQAAEQITQNITKTATGNAQVNPDVYSAIRQEVADALKAGVNPSAEVIARRADAGALPVPVHMTRAQLTRDPMQWAWEHRASGQRGVGEPLSDLLANQNRALVANLNELGAAAAPSPYDASQRVIAHIQGMDEQLRGQINEAYSKVRNSAGRSASVSADGFVQAAKNKLTDGNPELAGLTSLADYLPETIARQFNDISSGKLPLTVDTIQFLDRAWGGVARGSGDDTTRNAINKLRSALNEAPIDDAIGKESMEAYKAARQMAAQRFGMIDANPAYKAIVDGTKQGEPDKFFQSFIEGANVSQLKQLKQLIGPENVAMLQNTSVSQLKRAALNKASDEAGKFSQAGYNRILQDPVRAPRIRELFADNPKTLDQLYRVGRVAENLISAPAASRVNTSNTAGEMANIVRDVAKSETGEAITSMLPNWITGAKRVFSDAGKKVEEARAVQQAVNPGVTVEPLPKPRQASMGRLSDLLARGGAATAAADQREEERP